MDIYRYPMDIKMDIIYLYWKKTENIGFKLKIYLKDILWIYNISTGYPFGYIQLQRSQQESHWLQPRG